MCPKGTTMGALHHDPDRLRGPVIKKNGTWHEVGWEGALRHCERIAHPVINQYGSHALAAYTGNLIAKSFDLLRSVVYFFHNLLVGGFFTSFTFVHLPTNVSFPLL